MNIGEIISDALTYPFNNIMALVIYVVLGIILGLVAGATGLGAIFTGAWNLGAGAAVAVVGAIICIIIALLIEGYILDVTRYGIERRRDAPDIEFGRQVANGFKLAIVNIVYFILPIIIIAILGVIFKNWITTILGIILFIIFGVAEYMAECRLANTDDLGYALSVGSAIGDASRIGIIKILLVVIIISIIEGIIQVIVNALLGFNPYVAGIIGGILAVYFLFFAARATGLLYSEVA